jgi:mono/diheme cytochrome c family protein
VYGYNGILPLVQAWPDWFIEYQLQHLDTLKGYMPPFVGTEEERKALAAYLAWLSEE